MRKLVAFVTLAVAGLASAQFKPVPTPQPRPAQKKQQQTEFRRITQKDAFALYQAGKAVFIDVRSHEQFSYGHIKGALSIPNSQLMERFKEVPVGKTIITYCACSAEQSSGTAVLSLNAHGVRNVAALLGGWQEWKSAGLPVAVGPK
jgi:rhodanese-related sulfurtransferase